MIRRSADEGPPRRLLVQRLTAAIDYVVERLPAA